MLSLDQLHTSLMTLTQSSWFIVLHAVWVAYVMRMKREKAGQSEEGLLKGIVTHVVVSLGGSMLSSVLMGHAVPFLVSNEVLTLYIIGYCLVNGTPVYEFVCKTSPVSDVYLECFVDGVLRSFALMATVDKFRAIAPLSFIGQWLMGVVGSCGGGFLYRTVTQNDWHVSEQTGVLGLASALYVFSVQRGVLSSRDLHLVIVMFVVLFFFLRSLLDDTPKPSAVAKKENVPKSPLKKRVSFSELSIPAEDDKMETASEMSSPEKKRRGRPKKTPQMDDESDGSVRRRLTRNSVKTA